MDDKTWILWLAGILCGFVILVSLIYALELMFIPPEYYNQLYGEECDYIAYYDRCPCFFNKCPEDCHEPGVFCVINGTETDITIRNVTG